MHLSKGFHPIIEAILLFKGVAINEHFIPASQTSSVTTTLTQDTPHYYLPKECKQLPHHHLFRALQWTSTEHVLHPISTHNLDVSESASLTWRYFFQGSIFPLMQGGFTHASPININRSYLHKSPCNDRWKDTIVCKDPSSNDYLSNGPKHHHHQKKQT